MRDVPVSPLTEWVAEKEHTYFRETEQQRSETEEETTHEHRDGYQGDRQPAVHDSRLSWDTFLVRHR